MEYMEYFLLQGFFYQHQDWLDNAYVAGEGLTAVVREGLVPFMFAGAIWHQGHDDKNELIGAMQDDLGVSELRNIEISEAELSFSKFYTKYKGDPNKFVRYVFRRGEQNTWVGTFAFPTDPNMEGGISRCVLTEIDFCLIKGDINAMLERVSGELALGLDGTMERETHA